MADGKQEIGNPLTQAFQAGSIGSSRTPITSKTQPNVPAQQKRSDEEGADKDTVERKKSTFMLTPYRKQWLQVMAALEGREQSDILEEALATYEQLHPEPGIKERLQGKA